MDETQRVSAIVHLTRVYRFNAGHRLYHLDRSEDWNLEQFGKCSYPGGHGHNYTMWVTLAGTPCPYTGGIVNLRDLHALIEDNVMAWLDHRNLNEVLELRAGPTPTTEILITEIWDRLAGQVLTLGQDVAKRSTSTRKPFDSKTRLAKLKISETAKNFFEYSGQGS